MSTYDENVVSLDAKRVLNEATRLERAITQDGIARVFASRYADKLRFDHTSGTWFKWTGTHWAEDKTGLAFEFVRQLAREVSEDADGRSLQALRRTSFASGVERFARSDQSLAVTADVWDGIPFLLGTPGGTVQLTDGVLRPSEPIEMISKITAVAPSQKATCPIWLQFVTEIAGNAEAVRFLQQWCGYCLTGSTQEHALLFGHGPGGNGKSVFLNTVTHIFKDYAVTAPMDAFTASTGDRHPADLAMFKGARMVAASETERGRAWAENRIKQLTGGDLITARFMNKNWFTYKPSLKLTIIGNFEPALGSVDDALRRRFNIMPFPYKPEKPDKTLEYRLRAEWPGILRWMIDGTLDWKRNGLIRPAVVHQATSEYFSDQDLMGQWLVERCHFELGNPRLWAGTSQLFGSWKEFASEAGQQPETQKAFVGALRKRGLKPYRTGNRGRGFFGISLKTIDDY
jgi:putative DNA primase/helicase